MSGPLAIAATTAVLREVLQTGMTALDLPAALDGDVLVTAEPPDRIVRSGPNAQTQLNVFLYSVQRNAGWSNLGLPSRDGRGDRVAGPMLALDLCYLLTAYGAGDYHAEILLGGAAQVLHEMPGFDRDTIREALTPALNRLPVLNQLQHAGLAEQFEVLKVTPLPLPSEEVSRLWSALNDSYRPSMAYMVSVLLIESAQPARRPLPVLRREIRAVPWTELRIHRVTSTAGPFAPIVPQSTLRLQGQSLGSPDLQVWVDSLDVTAGVVLRRPDELQLTLALPPNPPGLRAGVIGVQVVQPVLFGDPPLPHEGFTSNVASFVLSPVVSNVQVVDAAVRMDVQPPVGARQRVRLLLNQKNAPPGSVPRAYSFAAPALATEATTIDVPVAGVAPGTYLLRLQVDGAESPLSVDGAGRFDLPEVML